MKRLMMLLLILAADSAHGQYLTLTKYQEVVTDSVVWRVTAVIATGDTTCRHDWVDSELRRAGLYGCAVYHNGFHCDWDDQVKDRICRRCLRKESLRESWYQHAEKPPETEYERLDRLVSPKRPDTSYFLIDTLKTGRYLLPLDSVGVARRMLIVDTTFALDATGLIWPKLQKGWLRYKTTTTKPTIEGFILYLRRLYVKAKR